MYKNVAKRLLAMVLICCMISSMPNLALLAAQTGTTSGETVGQPESVDLKKSGEEGAGDINTAESLVPEKTAASDNGSGIPEQSPGSGKSETTDSSESEEELVMPLAGGDNILGEGEKAHFLDGDVQIEDGGQISIEKGKSKELKCVGEDGAELTDLTWASYNPGALSFTDSTTGNMTALNTEVADWVTVTVSQNGSPIASIQVALCKSLESAGITIQDTTVEGGKVKLSAPVQYTGNVLKPAIKLLDNGTSIAGKYQIEYKNNIQPNKDGTAEAVITGNNQPNGYMGSRTVYFDVKIPISWLENHSGVPTTLPNQTKTALEKDPPDVSGLTIEDNRDGGQGALRQLTSAEASANEDGYTVSCTLDKVDGKADITVTLCGIYYGSKEYKEVPVVSDIADCTVELPEATVTYTGTEQKPAVTVKNGTTPLDENTDYTLEYKNNINVPASGALDADKPSVVITGKGKYGGVRTEYFTIAQADVKNIFRIDIDSEPTVYNKKKANGTGIPPKSFSVINTKTSEQALQEDYNIEYQNAALPGNNSAKVVITGKGNCKGTTESTYTIDKATLQEGAYAGTDDAITVTIENSKEQYYQGQDKPVKPSVVVQQNGETLEGGTDYTVTYGTNTSVGKESGTVTVTGTGNYEGSRTLKFEILPYNLSKFPADQVPAIQDREYTGQAHTLNDTKTQVLSMGENLLLRRGVDYQIRYINNVNVGDAIVCYEAIGENCINSFNRTFVIYKQLNEGSGITINPIDDQQYTGEAIKPMPVVKDGDNTLSTSTNPPNYTVSYSTENPVDVGRYTVTVTGDNKYYKGTMTTEFAIVPRKMETLEARFVDPKSNNEYEYDGNPKKPPVKVVIKGSVKELPINDFNVEWLNNSNSDENGSAGPCSVRITPNIDKKGNYDFGENGALVLQYTIVGKKLEDNDKKYDISIKDAANIIYDGTEKTPEIVVTDKVLGRALENNIDYTISCTNNINAGTDTGIITITGIGNYSGTLTKNFTIHPMDLSTVGAGSINIELEANQSYVYTGGKIVPTVSSIIVNGQELTPVDYELSSNAVNAGTGNTFTVKGKGNYTGSIESNGTQVSSPIVFTIEQKSIEDSDVLIEDIPNQPMKNGQEVKPPLTITYGSNLLKNTIDYTVEYRNNTQIDNDDTPEDQKPTAIITGTGNYKGTRSVTFHIRNSIEGAVVGALSKTEYTYSVGECRPKPASVTLNGITLKEGKDYELVYQNNVNAWDSKRDPQDLRPAVVVTGKGQYGGTAEPKYFSIKRVQVTKNGNNLMPLSLNITGTTKVFTGSLVYPDFTMTYRVADPENSGKILNYTLDKGKDFDVTNQSSVDVGSYQLNVKFLGNFQALVEPVNLRNYTVTAKSINSTDIVVKGLGSFDFEGKPIEPKIEVIDKKRNADGSYNAEGTGTYKLTADDCTITYSGNASPGTAATAKIVGKGNYTGTRNEQFIITGDLENAIIKFTDKTGEGDSDYKFTGNKITPRISVQLVSGDTTVTLRNNSDYRLEIIGNPVNCGTYQVRIIGAGAYEGAERTAEFNIVKRSLSDTVRIEAAGSVNYVGPNQNVWPEVSMTLGSYKLVENRDYELIPETSCWQPSNASKRNYTLTIKAKDDSNFTGSVDKYYTIGDNLNVDIKFIDENGVEIPGKVSLTYTGEAIKPLIKVTDSQKPDKVLVEGKDYGITYADDCVNVGAKTVIIYGLADYTNPDNDTDYCGSKTFSNAYTITAKNLADEDVTIEDIADQPYTSQQIKPEPKIIWKGKALQQDVEFRYSYGTNRDAGEAAGTVTFTGNGNFAGTKSKTFNITKKNIEDSDVHIDPIPDQLYIGGQDIKPVPTIKWGNPTRPVTLTAADYTVVYKQGEDEKSQDVGTVEMTITGAGKNYEGTITTTFQIVKVPLEDVKAELIGGTSKDSFAYTGSQIQPEVKLSYTGPNGKGEIIMTPELWGYTITYGQNQFVGTNGSITITADPDGNCTGSKTVSFKIEKRKLTDAAIHLEPDQIPAQVLDPTNEVTGIQPEVKVMFYPGTGLEPYQLVPGKDCRIEYSNNKVVTENATITITGMGNFDGTLTRTFRITQDLTKYIISAEIDKTKPLIYNGQVQYPVLNITFYTGVKLKEGTDYELVYQRDGAAAECKESGEYTVTIRGLGTYSGELGPYTFEIEKRALTPQMFHAEDQGYNGSPILPIVTGEDLERTLEEGVDYVIGEVTNNIDVGEVIVPIQAVETSNYQGSIEITYHITQTNLTDDFIDISGLEVIGELGELEDLKLEYTGNPLKPEITITDTRRDAEGNFIVAEATDDLEDYYDPYDPEQHYILLEEKDYTLQWAENQYPGQAEVTIVGAGNYEGTIVDHFTIYADLADAEIEPIPVQHYEGELSKPELTVTLGELTLTLNEEYSVEYRHDTEHPDRGEATAIISSADEEHYIGTNSVNFIILRSIAEAEIILPHNLYNEDLMDREILYTYTGSPVQPQAVVRFHELDEEKEPSTLTLGKDYTISYINNVNVGTANVVIEGTGYFDESVTTTFDITSRSVTRCSFSGVSDVMYDGSQTHQNLVVSEGEKTLEEGKDYRLEYINNVNPGISTITVTGIGNYGGVKTIHYLINLNNMTDVSAQGAVDSVSLAWNPIFGAEGYEIYNENNILIAKTSELAYTHTDLDALTTYQYKVRPYMTSDGATYYGGFSNLVQAQTGMKQPVITLKAKKKAAVVSWQRIKGVSGYEIYRSTKKKKGYKKIKTAKKASIVKYTNKKLTKKKKYYYKIRAYKIVDGKKVYSIYSSPKSVKAK